MSKEDATRYVDQAKDHFEDVTAYEIGDIDNFVSLGLQYLNDALEAIDDIKESQDE